MRYREIIQFEGYDIQERYDEFNRKYFNGELPEIPMRFAPLKNVAGKVSYQFTRTGKRVTAQQHRMGIKDNATLNRSTVCLYLSNRFKHTHEEFDATLLHEMIHVYFIMVANDLREKHGYKFNAMRRKISQLSGIQITKTEAFTDRELTDAVPVKAVGVVSMTRKDGKHLFALISASNAHTHSSELKQACERVMRSYTSVALYTVATTTWTKIASQCPIQRKLKRLFISNNEEDMADLIKNGHEIFKLTNTA